MTYKILVLSLLTFVFLPNAYSKEPLVAELTYPVCPDHYEEISQSVLQGHLCAKKLCLGDTVEVLKAAGNNIDVVIALKKKGTVATVMNRNNCDAATFPITRLKKLGNPAPMSKCKKKDAKTICKGDYVKVKGPLGTGSAQVQVLEIYTNKTATVNNMNGDQQATYPISRFTKIKKPTMESMPSKPEPQANVEASPPPSKEPAPSKDSEPQVGPDTEAPSILDSPLDPK